VLKLGKADNKLLKKLKKNGKIPVHLAIIMDGNGRWARKKGLPRVAGHHRGVETVRKVVKLSAELGIKYLTLYTFSTENWKRPKDEVSTLMRLIVKSLQNETDELNANNVRLRMIGDFSHLPEVVQNELKQAVEKTKNNTGLNLNLALSYSGRWEIIEAVKEIAREYAEGEITLDDFNEELFSSHLQTRDFPDPDLLIRSGGELRVSNYLLWQIAYSEIYVTKTLWPDFRYKNLLLAIEDYQKRERRFGLISEQVKRSNARKKHS
jgi:undecaprenyl diphosphate synthase